MFLLKHFDSFMIDRTKESQFFLNPNFQSCLIDQISFTLPIFHDFSDKSQPLNEFQNINT